jgi:hypothetical protein
MPRDDASKYEVQVLGVSPLEQLAPEPVPEPEREPEREPEPEPDPEQLP